MATSANVKDVHDSGDVVMVMIVITVIMVMVALMSIKNMMTSVFPMIAIRWSR
jgi:hypothetical protein